MENSKTDVLFFEEIDKKILIREVIESFEKKGFPLNSVDILEYSNINDKNSKLSLKIITKDNNKIIVERDCGLKFPVIKWKLNALPMGEVIGKHIHDVSCSYEYEKNKDR
jgi:hypothetical protein